MAKGEDRYKKPETKKPEGKTAEPVKTDVKTGDKDKPEMMKTAGKPEAQSPMVAASALSETHRRQMVERRDMNTRHEREHKEMSSRHMNELGGNLMTADIVGNPGDSSP